MPRVCSWRANADIVLGVAAALQTMSESATCERASFHLCAAGDAGDAGGGAAAAAAPGPVITGSCNSCARARQVRGVRVFAVSF